MIFLSNTSYGGLTPLIYSSYQFNPALRRVSSKRSFLGPSFNGMFLAHLMREKLGSIRMTSAAAPGLQHRARRNYTK